MKIAVIYNLSRRGVINVFGRQNREQYQADEIAAVVEALRAHKHVVETFEGDKFLVDELEAFMPRVLKGEHPGIVFNLAYGIQGESRYTHIPSLLEMLGIPYVGSGPLAHSVALDKAMTKIVLVRAGLPTPEFQVVSVADSLSGMDLRYPLMVKPKDEAVSFGVRLVHDEHGLAAAVEETLTEFGQPALVEEFLDGPELNVGTLGNDGGTELLPIVEVDFGDAAERYQTFETKKQHRFAHRCPAQLPAEQADEVRDLARRALLAVGCRDCARVDFRLDQQGHPHILEINSMPAIHRGGSYFAAAQQAGYDYAAMINRMVEVAVARYFDEPVSRAATPGPVGSREQAAVARVTDYLRGASERMERRLAELVDCNSSTRNKRGTDQVSWLVQRSLEQCHFSCRALPQTEIGDLLLLRNAFEGERADALLLAHTDVFTHDDAGHRRFAKEGKRLYGAGIAESKGGLVVLEYALRALRHLRLLSHLRIKVLLTTDHALGNRYSAAAIRHEAASARTVLSLKPGGPAGEVVTRRNGVGLYSALVESASPVVHTDYLHRGGANAIGELAGKVRQWNRLSDPADGTVVCVTSLRGEARKSKLPESGRATLFLSFPSQERGEALATEIQRIARRRDAPGAVCSLNGGLEHEPFDETPEVLSVYQELANIAEHLGVPLAKHSRYTASEINLVPRGTRAIDGLGPAGHDTRTEEEHIEAHTLVERAVLLALFLRTLATPTR